MGGGGGCAGSRGQRGAEVPCLCALRSSVRAVRVRRDGTLGLVPGASECMAGRCFFRFDGLGRHCASVGAVLRGGVALGSLAGLGSLQGTEMAGGRRLRGAPAGAPRGGRLRPAVRSKRVRGDASRNNESPLVCQGKHDHLRARPARAHSEGRRAGGLRGRFSGQRRALAPTPSARAGLAHSRRRPAAVRSGDRDAPVLAGDAVANRRLGRDEEHQRRRSAGRARARDAVVEARRVDGRRVPSAEGALVPVFDQRRRPCCPIRVSSGRTGRSSCCASRSGFDEPRKNEART